MSVAGAIAVIGAGASLVGGLTGSSSAKKAAKQAAAAEKAVSKERIEQLYREERRLAGTTRARGAASGIVVSQGSILNVLAEQALNFERERAITKKVGASRVAAALAGGDAASKQFEAQGLSGLFAGLGAAFNYGWKAGP